MAEKKYNPFSFLGEDDPQDNDVVNPRILRELDGMLDDMGLTLDGNKMIVKGKGAPRAPMTNVPKKDNND